MSSSAARGLLFVISAPSGTGKTTAVAHLIAEVPGLMRSRSYTSRAAHHGEVDGVDYNFIARPLFEQMIAAGEFLEWAEVFGNFYGTGQDETDACLATGTDVVLVIDVQGARQVRGRMRDAVGIFLLPPSFETLESRLRGRCRDQEDAIRTRLETARTEVLAVHEYDYVVVNDELASCVSALSAIVRAERTRLDRQRGPIGPIVDTFGAR